MEAFSKVKYNIIGTFCSTIGGFISKKSSRMPYSTPTEIVTKIVLLLIGMTFNSINLKMFFQSSQLLGTSTATILNFGFGFVFTNLFEFFILSIHHNPKYYLGIALVLLGLAIISNEKFKGKKKIE